MNAPPQHATPHGLSAILHDPRVPVASVAVAAVLVEAVVANSVLDVHLDLLALIAPLFVYAAYNLSGRRSRTSQMAASAAAIVAAAAVLLVYAL